jgi:hypothetical protein
MFIYIYIFIYLFIQQQHDDDGDVFSAVPTVLAVCDAAAAGRGRRLRCGMTSLQTRVMIGQGIDHVVGHDTLCEKTYG